MFAKNLHIIQGMRLNAANIYLSKLHDIISTAFQIKVPAEEGKRI